MRILAGMVVLVVGLGMAGIGAQPPAPITEADYDALMKKCKQCHGAYREGDAKTGFRIKAGTLAA